MNKKHFLLLPSIPVRSNSDFGIGIHSAKSSPSYRSSQSSALPFISGSIISVRDSRIQSISIASATNSMGNLLESTSGINSPVSANSPALFQFKKFRKVPSLADDLRFGHFESIYKALDDILDNIRENLVLARYLNSLPRRKTLFKIEEEFSQLLNEFHAKLRTLSPEQIYNDNFVEFFKQESLPITRVFKKLRATVISLNKQTQEIHSFKESFESNKSINDNHIIFQNSLEHSTRSAEDLVQSIMFEDRAISFQAEQFKLSLKSFKNNKNLNGNAKISAETIEKLQKNWEKLLGRASEYYERTHSELVNITMDSYPQIKKLSSEMSANLTPLSLSYSKTIQIPNITSKLVVIQETIQYIEHQLDSLEEQYNALYSVDSKKTFCQVVYSPPTSRHNAEGIIIQVEKLTTDLESITKFHLDEKKLNDNTSFLFNQKFQFHVATDKKLHQIKKRIGRFSEVKKDLESLVSISDDVKKLSQMRKALDKQSPLKYQGNEMGYERLDYKCSEDRIVHQIIKELLPALESHYRKVHEIAFSKKISDLAQELEACIQKEILQNEALVEQVCRDKIMSKGYSLGGFYKKWRKTLDSLSNLNPNFISDLDSIQDITQIHNATCQKLETLKQLSNGKDVDDLSYGSKVLKTILNSTQELLNMSDRCKKIEETLLSHLRFDISVSQNDIRSLLDYLGQLKTKKEVEGEIRSIARSQSQYLVDMSKYFHCLQKIEDELSNHFLKQPDKLATLIELQSSINIIRLNINDKYNNHGSYSHNTNQVHAHINQIIDAVMGLQAFLLNNDYRVDRDLVEIMSISKDDKLECFPKLGDLIRTLNSFQAVLVQMYNIDRAVEEVLSLWKKRHFLDYEKLRALHQQREHIKAQNSSFIQNGSAYPIDILKNRIVTLDARFIFLDYFLRFNDLHETSQAFEHNVADAIKNRESVMSYREHVLDQLQEISSTISESFSALEKGNLSDLQKANIQHLEKSLKAQGLEIQAALELKTTAKTELVSEMVRLICNRDVIAKIFEKISKHFGLKNGKDNGIDDKLKRGLNLQLSGTIVYKTTRNTFICPMDVCLPDLGFKVEQIYQLSPKELDLVKKIHEGIIDDEEAEWSVRWRVSGSSLHSHLNFTIVEI